MGLTHKILEIIFKSGLIDIIIISSLTIVMWTKIARPDFLKICQVKELEPINVKSNTASSISPVSEILTLKNMQFKL